MTDVIILGLKRDHKVDLIEDLQNMRQYILHTEGAPLSFVIEEPQDSGVQFVAWRVVKGDYYNV